MSAKHQVDTLTRSERAFIRGRVPLKIGLLTDMLFITACRISELLGVRLSECVAQGEHIRLFIRGKGKRQRFVYVKRTLFDSVMTEWQSFNCEFLFQGQGSGHISRSYVWRVINRAMKRGGCHIYRHTRCTEWLKAGEPVQAVSVQLGHSSVAVTLSVYSHLTMSVERMAS